MQCIPTPDQAEPGDPKEEPSLSRKLNNNKEKKKREREKHEVLCASEK